MVELNDYSGPFDPDFSYDKLSRDAMHKMLKASSDYIRMIDGYWYLAVMKECGNDLAFKLDSDIWEKLGAYTMELTRKMLNIKGDGVDAVAKSLQASPWSLMYDIRAELRGDNIAIISFLNCPTLKSLMKEGQGREKLICHQLERRLMEVKAHVFNPDIVVTPLKLPPQEPGSDISCQWELKLERSK
ncbi:MAG: DUF6125 family protein [Dehalococcoidia bacterium]|jgi:hypothetical protein